jgi:hypothetical protein
MSSQRAKYQCNPKLQEYIELSNIVPPEFDFDWSADEWGENPYFLNRWFSKLLELSEIEMVELFSASIDGVNFPFKGNISSEKTTEDITRWLGITLIQFQKLKVLRSFLRSLIRLYEVSKESQIEGFSSEKIHSELSDNLLEDIRRLYKLPACQKVFEFVKNHLDNVDKKVRMLAVVQSTANHINSEAAEKLQISDEEKSEFLLHWEKSLLNQSQDSDQNQKSSSEPDLFSETLSEVENKVSSVNTSIDSNGIVRFELNKYAEALQGVHIARLRLCEYCNRIFWANRIDTYTCSPSHARNRRMRLLRQNWKDKGDLYLKARSKKEGKKNGTL